MGLGVTQDYQKAIYWYRKSAAQGDPLSQHNLKMLPPEVLRKYDTTIGIEEITNAVVVIAATVVAVSIFDVISGGSGTGTNRGGDGSRIHPSQELVFDSYDGTYKTRSDLNIDKMNRD